MTSIRVIPLLLAALALSAYADVFSCGGFVKSDVPIDFSKIKVKLLTPEGHLRHEESVNAANGYYMIPVYTKGAYSIRVSAPEGWFFEPSTFDFKLDGKTDRCSLEEDINFSLSAFAIEGAVLSQNGQGPAGLKLELVKEGTAIASTITAEGGKYRFQAPPGKYIVLTEKGADVCISHSTSHVEVQSNPVKVEPPLKISGYPLSIIVSSSNSPLKDADIALFSTSDPKLPSCRSIVAADKAFGDSKFVCNLGKTDAKGEVNVPCLAPGSYHIRPATEGLTFSPSVVSVSVVDERVRSAFSVAGFTASGRVVVGGRPIEGVEVIINGKPSGRTDSSGSYTVSGLKDGRVEVSASSPHTAFKTLDNVVLSTTKRTIPDLTVEGFEICGNVERNADGTYETLKLASDDMPSDVQSVRPDNRGNFCRFVAPGKYSIRPVSAESSLAPQNTLVDVSSSADTSLQFTHFKTDVEIKMACIGACETMTLSLVAPRTGNVVTTARGVEHYIFKDISPGKYTVKIPESGRFCWEEDQVTVSVGQTKPAPAQFVQSGFNANIYITQPAKIEWQHAEQKAAKGVIEGKKGVNTICLPVAGPYKMQLSSCMAFDKPSLSINVPSDGRVEANAVSASVGGRVEGSTPGTKITLRTPSGEREISVDASGSFSFQEPLTSASQKLTVTPHSSTHLFSPLAHTFVFEGECEKDLVVFQAAKGVFIDGSVSPAVEGVEIQAVNKNDRRQTLKATTDRNGKYRIGPIRRAEDMEITATMDGYAFTEGEKHGDLKSLKLSQLTLTFEDKLTGEKLDDVMLYVRGAAGEKKTAHHTVEKDGQIKLAALAPGTFIRAVLQEYQFEPSTITVTMKEGEHDEKTIKGTRIAYSAFGVLREMSGAGLVDVRVEALSEQCDQHQLVATTKEDGTFRIRALKPGCNYRISVHSTEGTAVPHCFPSSFNVKMTDKDVRGLEMVAAPIDEGVELYVDVNVVAPPNARPLLKITVLKEGHDQIAMQTIPSPVSVYTYRNLPRDGSRYTVRVEADRVSSSALSFDPVEAEFIADSPVQVVNLTLQPHRSTVEVEISKSSIVAFVLFGALALFILNPQDWMEKLKMISDRVQGLQQSTPSTHNAVNKKRR